MDLITCKCAKCDAKLGTVTNLWMQVGKKYLALIPNRNDEEPLYISTSGSPRLGEMGTVVGGCKLLDARCSSCNVELGLKCLRSPRHHALSDGQFILRVSSLVLKSVLDGRRKADPNIKQSLEMQGEAEGDAYMMDSQPDEPFVNFTYQNRRNIGSLDSVDVVQLQADVEAQRVEIDRIDTTGFRVVSSFQQNIARIEQQVRQLNASMENVRREGNDQQDNMKLLKSEISVVKRENKSSPVGSRLGQKLQATDRVVAELRQALNQNRSEVAQLRKELSTTREDNRLLKREMAEEKQLARQSLDTSKEYASELSSLRREVKQLRCEVESGRTKPTNTGNSSLSAHELDILTSSISKIGNRASQIESLQMEFELFKTRIHRLEARPSAAAAGLDELDTSDGLTPRPTDRHPRFTGTQRRKRPFSGLDDVDVFGSSTPKRLATTSKYPDVPTAAGDDVLDWQSSSPMGVDLVIVGNEPTSSPQLTKAGLIDKRTTKHVTPKRTPTTKSRRSSARVVNSQKLKN